jgi:glycosyltransferase involved in cell wall biosynthesis
LLIIGDGPDKPKLQDLARTLHVADRAVFLGNIPDETKFHLLNIADIYVSAASHEGFGLVFLEAMAVGLPIISYDSGGHTDFLSDGKTGFLASLGDRAALIRSTQILSKDAALRRQMGQFNQRHVEHYYIENCAAKYHALYETVISERTRRDPKATHV